MIRIRKAEDRGQACFSWLDSRHTFSFGHYYDPEHMGCSALRVINDDKVKPAAGFETHGHRDMEIISLVLDGVIEHQDSEGNARQLPAGEYQLMSAGRGIYHSEYNASKSEPLRFLQIWIEPSSVGGTPCYQQKVFPQHSGLVDIVTPDGRDGTLKIKQNTVLQQLILHPGGSIERGMANDRHLYIHQITGQLSVNDEADLKPGDGLKMSDSDQLKLENRGKESLKALVFDLP